MRSPVDGLLGTGLCRWLGRGATVARCCHEFATCGDHCPTPVEREKYVAAKRNAPARCGGSDAPGFRYRAAQQHSGSGLCRRSSGKLQKQIAEALILLPQPFLEGDHRHNHGERVAADLAVFPPRPSAHLGKFLFGAMNQQPGSLHFLGNTTPLQKILDSECYQNLESRPQNSRFSGHAGTLLTYKPVEHHYFGVRAAYCGDSLCSRPSIFFAKNAMERSCGWAQPTH